MLITLTIVNVDTYYKPINFILFSFLPAIPTTISQSVYSLVHVILFMTVGTVTSLSILVVEIVRL